MIFPNFAPSLPPPDWTTILASSLTLMPGKKFDWIYSGNAAHSMAARRMLPSFFVLFESCEEKLENGEKPGIGNCSGTKYTVPKSGGKTLITESGGKWRLRGVYTPGDRTGPSQGLSDVELEPAQ